MSSKASSAAPLLPGAFARWSSVLAVALLAAGCGNLPLLGKGARPAGSDAAAAPPANLVTRAEPPAAAAAAPTLSMPPAPAQARMPAPVNDPPDAVPRVERISTTLPNLPYRVRGEDYQPHNSDVPMQEAGIASWYGEPFHGRRTANGEVYDMDGMTAAHKTMPLPSYAVVRNRRNGKQIVVRVNDRGPFKDGRVIDLSRAAARKLGISGIAHVEVRRLTHDEIRTGAWKQAPQRLAGLDASH
jgi:rare lipoprotein A